MKKLFSYKIISTLILLVVVMPCFGQKDNLTWWGILDVKKPLRNGWNLQVHSEWHQNVTQYQTDLWMGSPMIGKKINNWLRADGGWVYARTRTKGHGDVPSFARTMHRPFIQVIATIPIGNVRASFREYFEWVWMPETVKNDKVLKGIAYNEFRHRLKFEYVIPNSKFVPYVYTEARHYSVMEQARVAAGVAIKIDRHNAFDIGWFYQDRRHKINNHVISASYSLTL